MIPFSYDNIPDVLKKDEYYVLEITKNHKKEKPKRIIAEWLGDQWSVPGIEYDVYKHYDYTIWVLASINTKTLSIKMFDLPVTQNLDAIQKSNLDAINRLVGISGRDYIYMFYRFYVTSPDKEEVVKVFEANCERLGFSRNIVHLSLLIDAQATYHMWTDEKKPKREW